MFVKQCHNRVLPLMGVKAKIPTEQILVENSTYVWSHSLKKRLLKEGLLHYHCYICGLVEWQGKRISLQLDHKNGIKTDCRLENLRLLCPNCHSQTETFAGKRFKNRCSCGTPIHYTSEQCRSCAAYKRYGAESGT
jgi:5-methylcytosine-specific restriction endonuclease McrA